MTDSRDFSYAAVQAGYRETFPIYAAYLDVINERNTRPAHLPITESWDSPNAVSNVQAARIALERVGVTTSDPLLHNMAAIYIERLHEEVAEVSTARKPDMECVIVGHFYQFAACIPTPADWTAMDDEEKDADITALVDRMTPEMLHEAVKVAFPTLLQRVVDADLARIQAVHRG